MSFCSVEAAPGEGSAQYRLGRMLYEGKGLEKDEARGIELLQLAAEGSDTHYTLSAQARLAFRIL